MVFNHTLRPQLPTSQVSLCDHGPGDGGFCVVRGSHKLNLPVPSDMANGDCDDFREHVHQPVWARGLRGVATWTQHEESHSPPHPTRASTPHRTLVSPHASQVTRAGDVVIWSEATVHGATPWRGAHERRIALYRFAPANMGYGRGYLDISAEALASMPPQVV